MTLSHLHNDAYKTGRDVCMRYCHEMGLLEYREELFVAPTVRYLLKLYLALPRKDVILVERSYRNDIHPINFSAMSYDNRKFDPTPSTLGLSYDIETNAGLDRSLVEAWFLESWKFLSSGVVLLNSVCFESFSTTHACAEKVFVQKLLRDLIRISVTLSPERIHFIQMGKPAEYISQRIFSSLGSIRRHVVVHKYPNSAQVSHNPGCDLLSPGFTFEHKATSIVLGNCILRSRLDHPLTVSDYTSNMVNIDDPGAILNEHVGNMETAERVFGHLTVLPEGRSNAEVLAALRKTTIKYYEMMITFMAQMVINDNNVKGSAAKQSEWGRREKFTRTGTSTVDSS